MKELVDIHTHLLSSDVKFNRIYDKIALKIFGKKMGIDFSELKQDPYLGYTKALIRNIKKSKKIKKVVLFGVDAKFNLEGKETDKDITVCAKNEDVLELYSANKDIIIPFFSINPNRADALDLIDKYVALGFRGAKFLQNYWQIDLNDKRYIPYFKKLAEHNLPLIIHTGSENSIESKKEYESITMLEAPLREGVVVIAAHMGLEYSLKRVFKSFSKDAKNFNKEYFLLLDMLKKEKNLYADISAILTPFRAKVLRDLSKRAEIHDKLLFGTDFPVPISVIFSSYDLPLKVRLLLNKIKNPFDRYVSALHYYFKEDNPIFTNYKKVLTKVLH